jgi:UDP-N-acetylmuramoylalanine--D-glutamate ligase
MIEPDHLDVHADMDDYINAKANIRRHQTPDDFCLYHPTNEYSRRIATTDIGGDTDRLAAKASPAIYRYGISDDGQVYVKDGVFMVRASRICPTDALQLPGEHNVDNACAAISAARVVMELPGDVIEQGLRDFSGLPHRLKFVREVNEVRYYDDSIATTPGSAIAAMKAFPQPKIMVLGGSSKGAQFDEVAVTAANSTVKLAILIGDEADNIEQVLRDQHVATINLGRATTMADVVRVAHEQADTGDVVVLSPACASFGMFKNYSDRGEQFVAAVHALEVL